MGIMLIAKHADLQARFSLSLLIPNSKKKHPFKKKRVILKKRHYSSASHNARYG
jgi:hypothetical protein